MYTGTSAAGYAVLPGAGTERGTIRAPLPRDVALDPFVLSVANFHALLPARMP